MSTRKTAHDELVKTALSRSGVKVEYDALESEFFLLREMVKIRNKLGKTQEDIAKAMHTTTSAVGRLETKGRQLRFSPTIATLKKYADAINCDLQIALLPRRKD